MKTKKVFKRSKRVLARKPEHVFHVKETIYMEDYPGGPKKPFERIYAVDDFSNGNKPINYG